MVIPDFNGMNIILDNLVEQVKANSSYASKLIFEKSQTDFIDELITICRTSLRDSLVKKLIYIKNINHETSKTSADFKKNEVKYW